MIVIMGMSPAGATRRPVTGAGVLKITAPFKVVEPFSTVVLWSVAAPCKVVEPETVTSPEVFFSTALLMP